MFAFIFIISTAASGAFFAGIGCRRVIAKHRRPGWHLILLGVFVTTLLTALLLGRDDLFRPSTWAEGLFVWFSFIVMTLASAVIALVAATVVVAIFRARFRDENHVA